MALMPPCCEFQRNNFSVAEDTPQIKKAVNFFEFDLHSKTMCLPKVVNGHIKRVTDEDVRTLALEMRGTNVATCYIYTPINPKDVLGISLPFLVMIIKNLKKYFSFEIQILDDRNMRRRFRVSNYQTTTKVRPFGTTMPIGLNPGWNQIQFNLADFTKRAYGSSYIETQRIQVHANCRIRRIYFCDRLYRDEDLPNEYKLFYPCVEEKKKKERKVKDVRAEVPPPSEAGEEVEQEAEPDRHEDEFLEAEATQVLDMPPAAEEEAVEEPPASPMPTTEEINEEQMLQGATPTPSTMAAAPLPSAGGASATATAAPSLATAVVEEAETREEAPSDAAAAEPEAGEDAPAEEAADEEAPAD